MNKLRAMQLAVRTLNGYFFTADVVAESFVREFGLPVPKPNDEDGEATGEYAARVVEELKRQCQAYEDFTARDKT